MACDQHGLSRTDGHGTVQYMVHQRAPRQWVQHFGNFALHARSLARRHNDHVHRIAVDALFPIPLC